MSRDYRITNGRYPDAGKKGYRPPKDRAAGWMLLGVLVFLVIAYRIAQAGIFS